MTGDELYRATAVILGEELEKMHYYEKFALGVINQLLANSFRENNSLLVSQGKAELLRPPVLMAKSEEIPYEEALVRECFPYGLGALLVAEDDKNKFNWLSFEFENRIRLYNRAEFREIEEMC